MLDLAKENKIDEALKLVFPMSRPVGPDEDREHLQQITKAFGQGINVELLDQHVRECATTVVVAFTPSGGKRRVDADPFLLVKRNGEWRLLTDDPEQYDLSDAERNDLKQAQAWFKKRKAELRSE